MVSARWALTEYCKQRRMNDGTDPVRYNVQGTEHWMTVVESSVAVSKGFTPFWNFICRIGEILGSGQSDGRGQYAQCSASASPIKKDGERLDLCENLHLSCSIDVGTISITDLPAFVLKSALSCTSSRERHHFLLIKIFCYVIGSRWQREILTFGAGIIFLILAHPVNKTWTKYVRITKQTAFWREKTGESMTRLKCSVPIFVE